MTKFYMLLLSAAIAVYSVPALGYVPHQRNSEESAYAGKINGEGGRSYAQRPYPSHTEQRGPDHHQRLPSYAEYPYAQGPSISEPYPPQQYAERPYVDNRHFVQLAGELELERQHPDEQYGQQRDDSTCDCDCDYHTYGYKANGGCAISSPPPSGKACKCSYSGGWSCSGECVSCEDDSSYFCQHPDHTIGTCFQGGGDCEGYYCDCDYHSGGCKISTVASPGSACHCTYEGAWTCGGYSVHCNDEKSHLCLQPDDSFASCELGGGDCGGYNVDCDCDYHSGGCTISEVAPPGSACHCIYKGAWTCGGYVVHCNNESSPLCSRPDYSEASCKLGGGDCGGY